MKIFLSLSLFLITQPLFAIQWQIILEQKKGPTHHGKFQADLKQSVGEFTIKILEENHIPFLGTPQGLNSILGTPTGDKAIVIENDERMRVYGWCYEVDGLQPDVMPDKYYFKDQNSVLRWFYAYSLYDKGEWKSYCTPA